VSLETTKRISIKMCMFFIIHNIDSRIFRKGPAYCQSGMTNGICIDGSKVFVSNDQKGLVTKAGNIATSTPTTVTIMIENLLQVTHVTIDIGLIGSRIGEFQKQEIHRIESMYHRLRAEQRIIPVMGDSPSIYTVNSIQSATSSRRSHKKLNAPSTVSPEDSISSVSKNKLPMIEETDKHSVAGWVETSSVVSVESARSRRSVRSSSTVKPISTTSYGSSRRGSSYTMGREVVVRE
jgi:hypothetical protein